MLSILNDPDLVPVWGGDETIGWVYQYFNSQEERRTMREASQAPRNSRELAVRNQFFTPRYVVEFLTDNTLGRLWYEMRQGVTSLKGKCPYMLRRPDEVFLSSYAGYSDHDQEGRMGTSLLLCGTPESFPAFDESEESQSRLSEMAHCVDGYARHPHEDLVDGEWWVYWAKKRMDTAESLDFFSTQDLMDVLFGYARTDRHGGGHGHLMAETGIVRIANEVRRRILNSKGDDLSQEEVLKAVVLVPFREKKDPRDIKVLDPACGSGHFLLYAFELLEGIYIEAWGERFPPGSEITGKSLSEDFQDLAELRRELPRLILQHNLHGIDIDPRAVQIAALALWMRAQRSWQEIGFKPADRSLIVRTNIVCAEPMPGEEDMRREFIEGVMPRVLGQIVEAMFEKMKLAGEAGSLLKIETEIRDAVETARKQWQEGGKPDQLSIPGFDRKPKQLEMRFDVEGVKDEQFWVEAEYHILAALNRYAEGAANGYGKRRLFAKDAGRGFAFIDLCLKRYDVVMMNPPFGAFSRDAKAYGVRTFPNSANDILAAFVERFLGNLVCSGLLGAITSRTAFFITSFADWRREIVGKQSRLLCFADLGGGVMDDATVEAAAFVLEQKYKPSRTDNDTPFLRLLVEQEKELPLIQAVSNLREGCCTEKHLFWAGYKQFELLPDAPFVYWARSETLHKLAKWPSFEPTIAQVRKGLRTGDNFRFVRAVWEIPQTEFTPTILPNDTPSQRECSKWVPLVLSGSSQPWFSPLLVALNWKKNGKELRQYVTKYGSASRLIQAEDFYFKPGMSWTLRAARFIPYAIPVGCIPTGSRPMAFPKSGKEISALAVSSSLVASAFMRFYGDWFARPKFLEGKLKLVPWPDIPGDLTAVLESYVLRESACRRNAYQGHEPFFEFARPFSLGSDRENAAIRIDWGSLLGMELEAGIEEAFELDQTEASELYRDIQEALAVRGSSPESQDEDEEVDGDAELVLSISERSRIESLVSYAVGVAFGRWDIRFALDPSLVPKLPDPFDPLPVCPPGMLVGTDGLPAGSGRIVSEEWLQARPDAHTFPSQGSLKNHTIPDKDYPVSISWDGILLDGLWVDTGHLQGNSLILRIREVLHLLWKRSSYELEQEACRILGISDLNDYLCDPMGFFHDHIKRYSKSRRKAPIYWQLATPNFSYAIWIYYHRFTKDTFYGVLNDYVNPRLQEEERSLTSLRQDAGPNPTVSQRKEITTHESFVEGLRTFRDEIALIAPLWNPDLNDGVIINFAPLWRLVPQHRQWQKECKACWDKLVRGDYDWAHLAMHLWPERVVPKCLTDRSLAIAHGLEDSLWAEGKDGKWKPKKVSREELQSLIDERSSPTVKAALNDLLNAPAQSARSGGQGRRRRRAR